jgi:hypothetical protein
MNRDANVAASGETYTDIVRQQKKRGHAVFLVFIGDRVYNIALGSSEYLPRTLLSIWTKKAKQLFAIGLKMKTYLGAFLLIVGVAGVSSAAVAQTVLQACGPDIERYCPNAGPGKIKQCMKNHMQQLSPICIGTLVKKKQGMAQ